MRSILDTLTDHPVRSFAAGEAVLEQNTSTGRLYIMIEGRVQILRDGAVIDTFSRAGDVFGDLSALLGVAHTATVRAVQDSRFYEIADARPFLEQHPAMTLYLCELLARRLNSLTAYLVDLKQQYEGDERIDMVDEVLEALLHRQPRSRLFPRDSVVRDPETAG
ncbi:MAG TPA: cyclic nucleotide-binding domain-containing protein [Chthoniobacterales bacterium]|jgi:CRP-like cAMP-binding protein